ncbi:MAG TPA: hypothetical protein VMI10_13035 [Terriglobales bacterium]|nr:hypothetical protein [Terriglobales bacterium]
MKRMIAVIAGAILVLGMSTAWAQSSAQSGQSLGDAARAARKKKAQPDTPAKVYDNDNLPTTEKLSIVGPATTAGGDQPSTPSSTQQEAQTKAAAEEQRKQANAEMQSKLDAQKAKIDQLSHELDLDQREYRLRAAAFYSDAGNRLRNATQWDKDDAAYKTDIEAKQKALDEAKAQLTELQEGARKAGMREPANSDSGKDSDKQTNDDGKK